MLEKCILISFIFIFLFLYLYIKIEAFYGNPTASKKKVQNTPQLSAQILSEIARVLTISKKRIMNLVYFGDYTEGKLAVAFFIQEPTSTTEANATDSAIMADTLMTNKNFIITINGKSVVLTKISSTNKSINAYFDNAFLKTISKYSTNKYVTIPNDESLTKFYKLDFDKNYNIVPKM